MKKLKIAQIAPLWFSIPPKKYGGIERIISFLTEDLVRRGHKVTLFASGDSKTKARLISLTKRSIIDRGVRWTDYWWNIFNHSVAFEKANEFDIIHCHWEMLGGFFQRFSKTPVLHTLHNIPSSETVRWETYKHYKNDLNLVFISKSERRNAPIKFKNSWIIYNGINTSQFKFNPHPKDHFIWIARVSRIKGTREAIEIAKKAGVKLLLAGQIQPQEQEYFNKEIKPELNQQIQYLGELSQEKLSSFYGSAKGCLYPIDWEEPFGLVMVEAMACGTPVIVFDRGSAREVIKDKKTGFIVKDINEAVKAVKKINQIKRSDCRRWVEDNFSKEKMVDDYERLYYKIINKK
jgi:glycosyltransferase involved in cell wall biosynthesis